MTVNSRTAELQTKRNTYIPKAVANGNLNIAAHAKGATVTDMDGKKWIDFAGGFGALNVGHCHPKVTAAVHQQANLFLHPSFNVIMYEGYIKLAEKLCQITPGDFAKQAILFNTGAEAVENAIKIARRYTQRPAVVVFERGFHGRTNLAMSMTSKVRPYKFGFGPFAPEIYHAPYPYMYRKPEGMTDEAYIDRCIEGFEDFFIVSVAPETVACVVMEPVQGEGGFIIPPKKFVQYVRNFCTQHGIVFVADEIQTGFGRTGKFFAMEHFDVVPDLVTVSKSLAAGLPLSGVIGKTEMMNVADPGELGGTYCGNPVACAAALAVIDIIEEENLTEKAEYLGQKIEAKLRELGARHDCIGDIRRLGAMAACEIVIDRISKKPDKARTAAIVKAANDNGLLLLNAGVKSNVIRFLAPLVISDDELAKGFAILDNAFALHFS